MHLFAENGGNYSPPAAANNIPYANNPIFVREGRKFSIALEQVNPGWIHYDRNLASTPNRATHIGKAGLHKTQSQALFGKEVWIVSRITSLTPNSPLELEGKNYFKVTNVKLGTASFRTIPIDLSEEFIFTHEADTAYRVNIKVYEVDSFELKRAVLKAQRDNPGITGILVQGYETVLSTVGSLAGDAAVSMAKAYTRADDLNDPLLIESLLLQTSATVELAGTFHVYLAANAPPATGEVITRYVLVDPWKSRTVPAFGAIWDYSFSSEGQYETALGNASTVFTDSDLTATTSFIRLRVTQSDMPREPEQIPPGEPLAIAPARDETPDDLPPFRTTSSVEGELHPDARADATSKIQRHRASKID